MNQKIAEEKAMITMEHVAVGHQKDERGKMSRY